MPPPPTLSIRTTVFGVVLYLEVLFLPNIQAGSEPAPCPPPSQLGLQFSVLYYILKFSSSLTYRQVLSQPRAPPLSIRTTVFGVLYLEVLFLPNIQAGSEPAPCPPPHLLIRSTLIMAQCPLSRRQIGCADRARLSFSPGRITQSWH